MKADGKPLNILGIHPGALGDVILFAQLLHGLGGRVRLLCGGEKCRLLRGLGAVDEAGDFEALPMHELFRDAPQERAFVSTGSSGLLGEAFQCDWLISCFAAEDSAAGERLVKFSGAKRADFLSVRPPEQFSSHLLDYWAQWLGVSRVKPAVWPAPQEWQEAAGEAIRMATERHRGHGTPGRSARQPRSPGRGASNRGPVPRSRGSAHGQDAHATAEEFIVLHPGAGSREKCWPIERFLELARRLRAAHEILFVAGPTELDWWSPTAIDAIDAEFSLLRCPPLPLLAAILSRCRAFIGHDSGPAHLAAAVGAKTLAIFGPTNPRHFAPVGPDAAVISARPLDSLRVEEVLAALTLETA